ncbi:MAG: HEAT repeat domain-containing protein, partial [Ardenticatenaceae bacterium]
MATTLATYYQRLLNKTQFVNLHGIPYPRDRSGRSRALKVPLDNVYIQIQAIANKERKREEKAEEEHIAGQMREREEWLEEEQMAGEAHERERIVEEEQSEAQRHDKEALGIDKLLSAIRTLGEYLYRRGQVYEATARPEPVDPQAALQEHKRLVILGAPGSGKSTLLRYLARRAAEKSGGRLPILLSLRDYAAALAQDESLLLQEFALRQAAAGDAQLYQILSSAIESGEREPLWLMDALDEARNWAEHAARQASRLPGQLILTSRPIGYVGTGLTSLPHFEILPLTATNVDQFLQDWFAFLAHEENTNPEAVAKQVSSLKEQLEQRPRLKPLASNPLLLTFLVILYGENPTQALPHQRAELYRRYVEELLDRWESSRGQQHAGRGESIFQLLPERDARQAALDGFHYLGWRLHLTYYGGQGKQAPNKTTLVSALSNYLRPKWDTQAEIIAPAIFEFWQQAGLLDLWTIAGTEYLAFRHLTFQEYAAAWGIAQAWRRHPKRAWHFLRPRLHHYAWREPILLLVGILKEEHLNELVRRILRARSPYERSLHRDLRLAGGLLAEGAMLSKQLTQRIIGSFKQLRWNYDDAKKLGGLTWLLIYLLGLFVLNLLWPLWSGLIVAILCILCSFAWWGSFLAFEFLNIRLFLAVRLSIGTYIANRKPVIPLLQQIGTLALPALFHMSQDSDSYVRLATANALGEATPVPYLITTLFDSDWRAHQAAANALGQIGEAAAVPHLINALSDSESHVREEAANALGQIGEAAAVPHLINALSDSDGSVRWRAVKALGQIGEAAAVFHLIRALSDSNWHVREAAAKALGQIGEAAAVPHLITA